MAVSPERQWRATMNIKNEISLSKWDDVEPLHRIPFEARYPLLAVGKAGQWVAAVKPESPVIHVWKAPKFDKPLEWKASESAIQALTRSPDGQTLYSGSADGSLQTWNIEKGRETPRFLAIDSKPIFKLAVSPDGKYLAAGGQDAVVIYEIESGRAMQNIDLEKPTKPILAFDPKGTTLAISSMADPIELWDVKTGQAIFRQLPAIENVFALDDPERFGSRDAPRYPHLEPGTRGKLEKSFPRNYKYQAESHPRPSISWPCGPIMVPSNSITRSSDGFQYRDLGAGQEEFEALFGISSILAFHRTIAANGMMVSFLGPGVFRLSKFPLSPEERFSNFRVNLKGPSVCAVQFVFSGDAKILAAAFVDHSISVWDTQTGKQLHRIELDLMRNVHWDSAQCQWPLAGGFA